MPWVTGSVYPLPTDGCCRNSCRTGDVSDLNQPACRQVNTYLCAKSDLAADFHYATMLSEEIHFIRIAREDEVDQELISHCVMGDI